jgi:hypothetical protein
MTDTTAVQLPAPLATGAAAASVAAGPCALCQHGILRGDRYARLVPSGRLAHLTCIAGNAGTAARRTA